MKKYLLFGLLILSTSCSNFDASLYTELKNSLTDFNEKTVSPTFYFSDLFNDFEWDALYFFDEYSIDRIGPILGEKYRKKVKNNSELNAVFFFSNDGEIVDWFVLDVRAYPIEIICMGEKDVHMLKKSEDGFIVISYISEYTGKEHYVLFTEPCYERNFEKWKS